MKYLLLRKLILIVIIANQIIISQQRNVNFTHLSVEEGLSENSVNCIYQDSKGFMWFGTMDGLNKYDGYKFRIFRHEPGNSNSLSDYAVNMIVEDKSGIFWIATREGLNRFDASAEKFKVYRNNPDDPASLSGNFVTSLCIDEDDNLWIGTRNGLNKLGPDRKKFVVYKNDPADRFSLSNNWVNVILESSDGTLWVGTQDGLNKFDYKSGVFISYKNIPVNENSISNNSILALCEDLDKNLWIGTGKGLNLLKDKENGKIIRYVNLEDPNSLSHDNVRSIAVDKLNNIWIATLGGLNKLISKSGKFIRYDHNSGNPQSINSNVLKAVYIDRSGVVWISTDDKGLNKFSPHSQKFVHIKPFSDSGTDSGINNVHCFFEDKDGILWIGTGNGLSKIAVKSLINGNYSFTHDGQVNLNSGAIPYNTVMSVIEDNKGDIWTGTFGLGITKFDQFADGLVRYSHQSGNPNSLSHDFIHTMYFDSEGVLWIGTGLGGLCRYNPETRLFKTYLPDPEDTTTISNVEVTSIVEDGNGYLWIGTTTGGLNKFNKKEETFYHFKPDPDNKNSLSSTRINTLYLDRNGNLWIGTFGGGLNRFNLKENRFTHYFERDGLPSNTVAAIVGDKKGNLWLSTSKGISKFNPETNSFRNYSINEGLQANEFNPNSAFVISRTGYILFGGNNGFNIFHPDSITEDRYIPNIVFTDFRIFNKSVLIGNDDESKSPLRKHISFTNEITLSYSDDVFSFDFASLHYADPLNNRYAYMMEGFDREWIYSGNEHSASYTNLDPGTYRFKVKATNSDGVWSGNEASIKIVINPPWWQSWWAYFIYAAVFVSLILALRKYEMNRIRLKNDLERKEFEAKKLQEVDHMKSRFFANISHEFRTPLTLILGLLDKYIKKSQADNPDFKIMKGNAKRSLQLINQLLELSKLETGAAKIRAQRTDLVKFVRRISSSFVSFAEHKKIDFRFNGKYLSEATESDEIIVYIDREKMETVIYNLLSNALKFTPVGERIFIDVSSDDSAAVVGITNTGVSIPGNEIPHVFDRFFQGTESTAKHFEGTGIGLALVKELIEMHHGSVTVESSGSSTGFKLNILSGKNHFSAEEIIEAEEEITEDIPAFIPGIDEAAEGKRETEKTSQKNEANIVLVVEDHFDLRNFICEQLEEDYSVIEAEDGRKGLALAEEIIPDLIISDIMMPEMDGYQLCREIKNNIKTNHIPVVLLTAKAALEDKLEGLETGADDYLIKPFNTDELKTRVRNLIRLRHQMREKFRSEMVLKPAEVIVPSNQKVFMEKLIGIIEKHIEDENFSVEGMSKEIGMSRSQLHRKLKALSNQSPGEFIRAYRLRFAAELIKQDAGNIAEIAYKTGFSSQAYFTKLFQEMYQCTPTEFRKRWKSENQFT